jgi:hypothetical protein
MKHHGRFLFVILVVTFYAAVTNAQSNPLATVQAFYKYDWSHSQIVNRRNLDTRKGWISPSLYRLFLIEVEKERQYLKKHPTDKGYFGDGFPFKPLGEYFQTNGKTCNFTYRIGKAVIRGNKAVVDVIFFYLPPQCNGQDIYKIDLLRGQGGWKIDNITYANGSSLVAEMKKHRY